jgi:sterol desaturase/sphingolipid hydroxylase (fatty acid hydroxylase superfamily)
LAEPPDRNYASMLPWMDRLFGNPLFAAEAMAVSLRC